jgi:riboflavin kinase/FMN adenylyltransferase
MRGRVVSSSEVRRLVQEGRVALAGRMLERPFALAGPVVKGRGVGSKQTVPTLNLAPETEVLPATGVYATRATDLDDGRRWPAVTNAGYRPTFEDAQGLTIETFLLKPLEGASPRRIRVEFCARLREERQFDSPEALKAQILKDAERAAKYFRRTRLC